MATVRLLAFDGSGPSLSVALYVDGQIRVEQYLNNGLTHSQTLLPTIERVLAAADCRYADLTAVAVTKGPGSYTGLRIALTTAKTLAFSLNIPLYAFSTLAVLAYPERQRAGAVLCALDARGGRVFAALYRGETCLLPPANRYINEDLLPLLPTVLEAEEALLLKGSGAPLVQIALAATARPCSYEPTAPQDPLARDLAYMAAARMATDPTGDDPLLLDADYCSPSQAERLAGQKQQA